jgi:hypothetical protein
MTYWIANEDGYQVVELDPDEGNAAMRCSVTRNCGSTSCWVSNCSTKERTRKYVKTKDARTPLRNDCEQTYDSQLKTSAGQAKAQALVRLIAQVLDASGGGEDCSLRISATKNKDAYCVTLYQDKAASYASSLTWDGLLDAVEVLL